MGDAECGGWLLNSQLKWTLGGISFVVFMLLLGLSSAYAVYDTQGLNSYYTLDNNLFNLNTSTPNLNGTYSNYIAGINNNGTYFDGTSSAEYNMTDWAVGTVGNNMSVSFWFKTNDTSASPVGVDEGNGQRNWAAIFNGPTLTTRTYIGGTNYDISSGNTSYSDNAWHFFVMTFDGQKTYLYLDGTLRNSGASVGSIDKTNTALHLGSSNGTSASTYTGILDEVGIWNITLTPTQITTMYSSFPNPIINVKNYYTLSYLSNFTINISNYNGTDVSYSTTTANLSVATGVWNITVCSDQSPNYFCSTTNNQNISIGEIFYLVPFGYATVEALNSINGSRITVQPTTLIIENSTSQLNYTLTAGILNISGLSLGESYTFSFNSSGYDAASYSITYDATFAQTLFQAFLSQSTSPFEFVIYTRNGQTIQDALVTVEKFVNGSYILSGSELSNVVGSTIFNVLPGITHRINVTKDGFITTSFTDKLNANSPYSITLFEATTFTFDSGVSGVSATFTPDSSNLSPNITTITFTVSTASGILLDDFSMALYDENSTLIGSNSSTNTTGGQLAITKNLAPYNTSYVLATFYYTRANYSTAKIYHKYYVATQPYTGSIIEARDYIADNIDLTQRIWLWALFIVIATIVAAVFIKGEGVLPIVAILAAALAYLFSLNMYLVGTLVSIILIYYMESR